jgi:hypothetical protein
METVALLYEDYQKELAEDFKNTFLKRASDTDSSRSNDTVIDEVTDMLSTNIAVYTEKLLQRWGFSSGGEGGGGGDVTVTLDDLLKKYLSDNYVTIKGDQEVFGEKDFRKGIRIAGRRLYWDEGNDALVIEGAAYTTRWLSAKGVSPGGGGAGSGGAAAMYQLIDVSPNDTKDAVLGAEKDYVLTFDGSFWRGMPNKGGLSSKLFTALDKEGNEVNPDDENAEIYAIRANYSLWSVGFLSAKGISDGGTGGGGGGAVALYQLLDVEKNADITGVAGATKGSVLTFNGDKWYADKPKTAAGISNLFTALDKDGNDVDLNDESKLSTITNIRANYALWSVDWISAKGQSSGGSGGGGGLINLVYGFESLGGTFDNNDNSATFNAFTINEIWKLASSGLTNVTVTGSGNAVTDVIKGSDGRSLTFTKGSTFATKSEFDALNTKFNDFLTGSDADDIINKWSELEVFLQGMKESDNLAVILQSKMDKTAFSKLFTALDASGNEVDPSDDTKTIASIRANFGFWGVDYISAKGVSNGSGGTGGASALYQLVDVLANDTEDGVEGAAAGKALVFDGTHWRAGDAGLNESQLYSYLTANKYLTQSAADSRYVTSSRKVIAGTGLSGGGALTSDVTLSLGTSGVVAGTYTKVMVDAYGRVTSGTNLSATDIPNLDWSKITTGKPTTLAGYGITDAVTLTTAQTISGRKTFSQNIVFNNNGGITYPDRNVALRNSDGHTILASFGNGEINLRPNGHNNTEGAVWINKAGNVQAPSVSTNTITIGDAQLVYDSANKALRVKHRTDGNTVGFYSDGWITALGVQTGGAGGGSGVIKTVYSFANLTDGTTFSDSDLNNTFNAYTVKEIWKMAKEGGGIKNIAQSGSGNAITDMTLSSDGKTITAVFGETFARQQDLGTLNNTVTQLSNKLNNFLEGLTGNDTLTELLALKADKTITISAGTGLTGGGNLSANRTLSLATTGVKAGTYTKVTVDTYGRVTVGDNPTTLAGYGITDAYTKTEADGKYVTIATPQTITGQKTFTKNIAMNSGIGLSYSGNTVFRNTSGNTVISSYGDSGMLYFRPNGDTSDVGVVQINKQGHINGVSAGFKGGVSAARLSATEYVQIGDAYLKWDAANNAVYVIKKDGTTPVGFYSTDWLSAKGVSMSGAQTGTLDSLNDVEITDPVNGQALKYDAASKKWVNGTIDSFNVNQMWAELKKADSSKIIDASHIPTSVLDGRWVKKTGDTMTGTLTSASSSGSIVFKGVENCDITNIYKDNGVIKNDDGNLTSIRNGLRFNWYDTYWYIGNLRGSSTESVGFGVVDHNNKLVLRVTPNDVRAPRFMSTVATGLSPLIVSSNTTVDNLSADLLDGTHLAGFGGREGVMRSWCRGRYTTVNQYFGNGNVVTIDPKPTDDATLSANTTVLSLGDVPARNTQLAFHYDTDTIKYRRHDGSKWNDWVVLIHSGNYASYSDGRYVKKAGDTMTGALHLANGTRNNAGDNCGFGDCNIGGCLGLQGLNGATGLAFIQQGASWSGGNNYKFTWNGSNMVSSSTALWNNLNADMLDNWHLKFFPRNYNNNRTYAMQFALGGTDNGWKKIFACSESGARPYQSVTVWGQIWYAYGNHANDEVRNYHFCAIFQMRSEPSASGSNVGLLINSARLYLPTFAKGMDNIRLVRVGTNNFELQVRQIGSYHNGHIQYQYWAYSANVSAWENLQSTSNTSVAVSAGDASTLADSRASSADVWTNARTFYIQDHNASHTGAGISVNGSSNVYLKLPSSIQCSAWFRSTGNSGWYHQDYGGGIYMQDSTWVRVFGGKRFYVSNADNSDFSTNTAISTEGGIYAKKNITSSANIIANGAITAKASSSDIRLKTDIQGYDAMGIIRKFRSVKYHWNAIAKENSEVFNHDNWNYGLIAQDLLSGGYSQWVKDAFNDYYTIDYERLIPVVWKGLQEVDDEVTKLKREVARLNKRVKELEKSLCA